MGKENKVFSIHDVEHVAAKMRDIGKEYEQLFSNFGRQMYLDLVDLTDNSRVMATCIEHIDTAIDAFEKHFPGSSGVACQKGCHHCCSFHIECPPQVVLEIARHLNETLTKDQLTALLTKLHHDSDARKNPLKRAACPFLDHANTCTIYHVRPLSCRWFSSPDVQLCKQSLTDGRNIPQHPTNSRIYQVATSILLACAENRGKYHKQVAFIPALTAILASDMTSDRWWDLFE